MKNIWELLELIILQAGCPSCHPTDAQAARATRGYRRLATVSLLASALNGTRPPVMGIPG